LSYLAYSNANPYDKIVLGSVRVENLGKERYNEEENVNHKTDQEELLCSFELLIDNVSDDWGLVTVIGEFLVNLKHVISHFKLSYI